MAYGCLIRRSTMKLTALVIAGCAILASSLAAQAEPTERSERRAKAMEKFDKNGDGKLDREERAAARAERRQKSRANPEDSPGRRGDAGQRGQKRRDAMRKRFDKNQDGKLDDNEALVKFATGLEKTVIETVEGGQMTKDLALLVGDKQGWLTTTGYLEAIAENFEKKMA